MGLKKSTFNHIGSYRCICGKEFDNSQSYNAHKGNCEAVIGQVEYERRLAKRLLQLKKGRETQKISLVKEKEAELEHWLSEKRTCERRGKIMTEKYGSGRFCSAACAKSHTYDDRSQTEKIQLFENVQFAGKN